MLLVDDLLTAPVKGLIWVFEEIRKSASAEQGARRDEIMAALSALYRALEQGEITDDAFDTREQSLLDELDALDAREDAEALDADADADKAALQDPDEDDASTPGRAAEVFAEAVRSVEIRNQGPSSRTVSSPAQPDEDAS